MREVVIQNPRNKKRFNCWCEEFLKWAREHRPYKTWSETLGEMIKENLKSKEEKVRWVSVADFGIIKPLQQEVINYNVTYHHGPAAIIMSEETYHNLIEEIRIVACWHDIRRSKRKIIRFMGKRLFISKTPMTEKFLLVE
jgi:hypothetical protein